MLGNNFKINGMQRKPKIKVINVSQDELKMDNNDLLDKKQVLKSRIELKLLTKVFIREC